MTQRLCKLNRRDIRLSPDMIYQYVKEPKFFCTSCARSANHQSMLCKPAALPVSAESKRRGKTTADENKRQDVVCSVFQPLKASSSKKIRKAQKRYKKATKKLKKIEKKQKKLLKRTRKIEAEMKGYESRLNSSKRLHIGRFH